MRDQIALSRIAHHGKMKTSCGGPSTRTMKTCPDCITPNPHSAVYCFACGTLFIDDTPQADTADLRPGQVLRGQYTIEQALRRGGMGAIYLASQTIANNKRKVIIKARLDYYDLNDPQGKRKARERFEKEAGMLVKLNVAGVPQIFDYFSEGDRNYIVMQYVRGQSLEQGLTHKGERGQIISGTPYSAGKVRRWGLQVCRILENLAALDVVHMDIKPANLIEDKSGHVWLVDFGTARSEGPPLVGNPLDMQKTSIFGTAGYAPREQYLKQAEPRSDVYSLAATLYHLLTDDDPRQHPFEFPNLNELPPGLAAALEPALAQNVNQRVTATQFHQLLEIRRAVGAAFRWRDGTASHQPEELVEPAGDNWAEAREYFSGGHWEQWFMALHRNDILAQMTQVKKRHQHLDVALDAFLRILDPDLSLPALEITPLTLDFSIVPWQTQQTLDLEIKNVGGGCVYGKIITPTAVYVNTTGPVDLARLSEPAGVDDVSSGQDPPTVKLAPAAPPLAAMPSVGKSVPPDQQDTANLSSAANSADSSGMVLPSNRFITPDRQTLNVMVDTANLTPREQPYEAQLLIEVGLGTPAKVAVPVTVTVPKPQLAVTPSTLNLGATNRSQTSISAFTVKNLGGSAFEGQVQVEADWVSVQPARFRSEPGSQTRVMVKADGSRASLGRHTIPLTVQAQAGKWQMSQEVSLKLNLPWLRTAWHSLAPTLDAAALGLLLMISVFLGSRTLLGFAPYLGVLSILILVLGGVLAFMFPKALLVALLVVVGIGLGYIADLWLGLAPTLALAGGLGLILGAGLRRHRQEIWLGAGLFGLVILIVTGMGLNYFVTQPDFLTYGWRRVQTLNTGSTGLAVSPDGATLASTTHDETVQLLHLDDGALVHTLSQHKDDVTDVAFSTDGSMLASGSADKTVWLWQRTSGAPVRMLAGHTSPVLSLAFSIDGALLASGTDNGTIWLWQVADGILANNFQGHAARVTSLAFSLDDRLLASGGDDARIRLWTVEDGELQRTLTGHTEDITSITFSPNGQMLASGAADNTVHVWPVYECANLPGGCETPTHILTGHSAPVSSVAFSPDGTLMASGSYDKTIKIWRVSNGVLLRTLKGPLSPIYRVTFTPDGTLVSTSEGGTTQLWSLAENGLLSIH